jgi:hypothetical protein
MSADISGGGDKPTVPVGILKYRNAITEVILAYTCVKNQERLFRKKRMFFNSTNGLILLTVCFGLRQRCEHSVKFCRGGIRS